jgi:hypothetical protein
MHECKTTKSKSPRLVWRHNCILMVTVEPDERQGGLVLAVLLNLSYSAAFLVCQIMNVNPTSIVTAWLPTAKTLKCHCIKVRCALIKSCCHVIGIISFKSIKWSYKQISLPSRFTMFLYYTKLLHVSAIFRSYKVSWCVHNIWLKLIGVLCNKYDNTVQLNGNLCVLVVA